MRKLFNAVSLIGDTFGKLKVISICGKYRKKNTKLLCLCSCGKTITIEAKWLLNGRTKSCGCDKTKKETIRGKSTIRRNKYARLRDIWRHMCNRCLDASNVSYKNYGGRGIDVCDEWVANFSTFRDWAIQAGYNDSLSIERIDVNGNYCPENCKWIPKSEQSANRRNVLLYAGRPAYQIAAEHGISHILMYMRITHYGWPIEEAIGLVPHKYKSNWGNRINHGDGRRKTKPRKRNR